MFFMLYSEFWICILDEFGVFSTCGIRVYDICANYDIIVFTVVFGTAVVGFLIINFW